eukprot:5195798-Amphidinium_carterae.2
MMVIVIVIIVMPHLLPQDNDEVIQRYGDTFTYSSSFHWTLAQITLGAMEINPTNSYERSFCVVLLLVGMIFNATIVSTLGCLDAAPVVTLKPWHTCPSCSFHMQHDLFALCAAGSAALYLAGTDASGADSYVGDAGQIFRPEQSRHQTPSASAASGSGQALLQPVASDRRRCWRHQDAVSRLEEAIAGENARE